MGRLAAHFCDSHYHARRLDLTHISNERAGYAALLPLLQLASLLACNVSGGATVVACIRFTVGAWREPCVCCPNPRLTPWKSGWTAQGGAHASERFILRVPRGVWRWRAQHGAR
jgi:hypothetical protein